MILRINDINQIIYVTVKYGVFEARPEYLSQNINHD
jgi:hypothetical protein